MLIQNAGIVSSVPSGASLLLDTYTGAAAAYSVARKLRTAYSGSAIRVRESGGDTELDIGFDGSGNLDESALTTHCGANDGFVVKWYDQSGNSRDASRGVAIEQPKIVDAGTVTTDSNGNPIMEYDGTNDVLTTPSALYVAAGGEWSVFVCGLVGTSGTQRIVDADNGTPRIAQHLKSNTGVAQSVAFNESAGAFTDGTGASTGGTRHIFAAIRRSDEVECYQDGSSDGATATTGTPISDSVALGIGGRTSGTDLVNGDIQEVIFYGSDESGNRSNIETNINDYYTVF